MVSARAFEVIYENLFGYMIPLGGNLIFVVNKRDQLRCDCIRGLYPHRSCFSALKMVALYATPHQSPQIP